MSQTTINQRIKFLLEHYKLSVRAFSELIDHKAANTQNYVGTRGSMPGADYLQSIIEHFEGINPSWLLTGRGEPFLGDSQTGTTQTGNFNQAGTSSKQTIKGNKGNVQTGDGSTMNNLTLADCKTDLEKAQREIEYLRGQLTAAEALAASKDVTIAAKEETISLLRATYNRPN